MNKICTKCRIKLDYSKFYKDKRTKDGLYSSCKKCHHDYSRIYIAINLKKWKEYGKEYRLKNKEKLKELRKKWVEKNRESMNLWQRNYVKKYEPKKRQNARAKVYEAIKRGDLIKQEEGKLNQSYRDVCSGRIEAHHGDYDKPLEVTWLCKKHHAYIHKLISYY